MRVNNYESGAPYDDGDYGTAAASLEQRHQSPQSKFWFGIILLLFVDVIWVSSSEATRYLFKDFKYNKPYMSTYVKISLFTIYLLGFVFSAPWRRQCIRCACDDYPGQYQLVGETDTDTDDANEYQIRDSLSESFYVPAKIPSAAGDNASQPVSSQRVKFNEVMEVRHLEDDHHSNIARMNYGSAMRAKMLLKLESGKLSIQQIVRIALLFSMLFFVGNLAYQESLAVTEVALVNIFSSTSAIFTLLLSSLFPSHPNDRLSISKLFAVVLSLTGLVLVSLSSGDRTAGYYFQSVGLVTGIMWSLLGAFCYSVYLVMFKRAVGSDDNVDIPMFFGFVGLFTMSLLWPGMLLLHYTGVEKFELPDHTQIVFLLANGLIGTVLSELLWLWGCMLTSSLYGTMSLSLTIPLSVLMDIVIRKVEYNWMLYAGIAPTVASLVAVGYLAHTPDRDPVRRLLRHVFCRAGRNTRSRMKTPPRKKFR